MNSKKIFVWILFALVGPPYSAALSKDHNSVIADPLPYGFYHAKANKTIMGKLTKNSDPIFDAWLNYENIALTNRWTGNALAKISDERGVLYVFTVAPGGEISDIQLRQPSRSTALDERALELLKSVGALRPLPRNQNSQRILALFDNLGCHLTRL